MGGVLLGAIIGGAGSIAGGVLAIWYQNRRKRDNLRSAFRAEIGIVKPHLDVILLFSYSFSTPDELADEDKLEKLTNYVSRESCIEAREEDPVVSAALIRDMELTPFTSVVYENGVDKIGQLTEDELEALISYYFWLDNLRSSLEEIQENLELSEELKVPDEDPDLFLYRVSNEPFGDMLCDMTLRLCKHREKALKVLEK